MPKPQNEEGENERGKPHQHHVVGSFSAIDFRKDIGNEKGDGIRQDTSGDYKDFESQIDRHKLIGDEVANDQGRGKQGR